MEIIDRKPGNVEGRKSGNKIYNIEFLRFLFSLLIVYYHLLSSDIVHYGEKNGLYSQLQNDAKWSYVIVECFVIWGVFLYYSEKRSRDKEFVEIFADKLMRLWPVFAFYILINVLFYHMKLEEAIFELSFLHSTGISLNYGGIIWYIAPYFWSTIFLIGILRSFKENTVALALSVIAWFGYCVNLNFTHGSFGREPVFSFLNLGLIRVLSGLAFGCLIAMFMEGFKRCFGTCDLFSRIKVPFCTVLEIMAFVILMKKFVFGRGTWSNAFIIIIIFTVLLVSFINMGGWLARILNKRVFGMLGKYAYSIYVMQQIAFWILRDTFWKNTVFITEHVYLSLALSVLFTSVIGIVTYHLIEKPGITLYQYWKNSRAYHVRAHE